MDRTLNGKFIAVVIGEKDSVNVNAHLLRNFNHMASLDYEQKKLILSQLRTEDNMLCYCIEYDIPSLLVEADARLVAMKAPKHKRISDSIGSEMKQSLQKLFADFLLKNRTTIQELIFEADDPDVIEYVRKGGLSNKRPALTHKIADCIAHANGKHWHVNSHVRHSPEGFKQDFHKRVLNKIYR